MVLWICIGAVVLALGILLVLLFDLRGKQTRFEKALAKAQRETAPAVEVVQTLADVKPPSIRPAKPTRTLVGQSTDERDRDEYASHVAAHTLAGSPRSKDVP